MVNKDRSGIAPIMMYLPKYQIATIIWRESEVEGGTSIMRSIDQTNLGPGNLVIYQVGRLESNIFVWFTDSMCGDRFMICIIKENRVGHP